MNCASERKFKELLEHIHHSLEMKKRRVNGDDFVEESKILATVLAHPDDGPRMWSDMLSKELFTHIGEEDVLKVLRYTYPRLNSPADRNKIIPLVYEVATAFKEAIEQGQEKNYAIFVEARDKILAMGKNRTVPRLMVLAIFNTCTELNRLENLEVVYSFRDTVAKYVLFDMSDALAGYCDAEIKHFSKSGAEAGSNRKGGAARKSN